MTSQAFYIGWSTEECASAALDVKKLSIGNDFLNELMNIISLCTFVTDHTSSFQT
jgi:hypothetical protein